MRPPMKGNPMFKKHSIQLSVVKTPRTTTKTEEQKPFMTRDEIIFAKYVMKNVALFAIGYVAVSVVLNTASEIVIHACDTKN